MHTILHFDVHPPDVSPSVRMIPGSHCSPASSWIKPSPHPTNLGGGAASAASAASGELPSTEAPSDGRSGMHAIAAAAIPPAPRTAAQAAADKLFPFRRKRPPPRLALEDSLFRTLRSCGWRGPDNALLDWSAMAQSGVTPAPAVPIHNVSRRTPRPGGVEDRYRSLFVIGRGGMGTVEVALERGAEGFDRVVALKRLLPEQARDPRHKDMFLREARLAALLQHPNVVHAFAFGELYGELFLAMEYVEGETLAHLLAAGRDEGQSAALSLIRPWLRSSSPKSATACTPRTS